jgi:hypothetical protein
MSPAGGQAVYQSARVGDGGFSLQSESTTIHDGNLTGEAQHGGIPEFFDGTKACRLIDRSCCGNIGWIGRVQMTASSDTSGSRNEFRSSFVPC